MVKEVTFAGFGGGEIDFSPECTNLALPDILCFVLVFIATTLNIISVMRWPPPNCQPVRRCQDSIDWFGTFLYRCHGWSYVPDGAKVTSSYFDDFVRSVFLETDENGSVMVFMTKTKVWKRQSRSFAKPKFIESGVRHNTAWATMCWSQQKSPNTDRFCFHKHVPVCPGWHL